MDTEPARRHGMTIPFDGIPLHAQRDLFMELEQLGYTDVWSSEANGADAFTPLALASVWAPTLRARGRPSCPPTRADPPRWPSASPRSPTPRPAGWPSASGRRRTSSSSAGTTSPSTRASYRKTRDMVRFLRKALTGEKVKEDYDTFSVKGFKLGIVPEQQPLILIAALREGMLRLAGREGDGAIINWLAADDVKQVVPHVHAGGAGKEVVARIFVAPTTDADLVHTMGRYAIAAYLTVPVYAEFHRWLGRAEVLQPMWDAWAAGDRKAALAAIPESLVDQLIVHGSPEACREHLDRYVENGVTCPAIALLPFGIDTRQAIRDLAPRHEPGAVVPVSTTNPPEASALVVEVPLADPVVGAWRARYDPVASHGMPAHVTCSTRSGLRPGSTATPWRRRWR